MWYTLLTIVHVLSCFFLVIVVLLQQGKGADVGAVFGGSSQTLFGSSGAGTLLSKMTSAIAGIFMLTSLTLTYGAAKQTSKSLFDDAPVSAPAPAPAETAPTEQPSASTESQGTATAPSSEASQPAPAAVTAPEQTAPAAGSSQTAPTTTAPAPSAQAPATAPPEATSK
jgi:preprotein translocase subunit SecG